MTHGFTNAVNTNRPDTFDTRPTCVALFASLVQKEHSACQAHLLYNGVKPVSSPCPAGVRRPSSPESTSRTGGYQEAISLRYDYGWDIRRIAGHLLVKKSTIHLWVSNNSHNSLSNNITLLEGDCLELLPAIPDGSVVEAPPAGLEPATSGLACPCSSPSELRGLL